ncbi:MAG: D-alanyl-D-alanine carboxypeptidase [Eubacteriaceae bacterium]|nr:D-alanyl-D-alanine carboxypeptidase [Eubacteriaceae bacterium]
MFKKTVIVFILSVFLFFNIGICASTMTLKSECAVLVDAKSGKVLFAQNENKVSPPASVTKVMTMLLVMKAIDEGKITLDDEVTISEYASKMGGTQLFIEPGEKLTVRDLLYGVSVESANDAATALGEYIAGSNDAFVAMMNDEAKRLGMKNTVFKNANGLPEDGHVTTAYDIALMSCELAKYDQIFTFTKTWMVDVKVGMNDEITRTLANTNKLLVKDKAIDGLKTGYTTDALYCISATKKQGDLRLIAVIMRAPSADERSSDVLSLLNYGFANYEGKYYVKKGDKVADVNVNRGHTTSIEAVADSDIYDITAKGAKDNAEIKIDVPKKINAPIKTGDVLGTMTVTKDGAELGKCNITAKTDIAKTSIFKYIGRTVKSFFKVNTVK